MQQIERLTEKDFEKYKGIFTSFGIVSGNEIDDGYKIIMNGQEYLAFPFGPIFMVYKEEEGKVVSSFMQVDDLMNLVAFTHDNKQILVKPNGIDVIDENHFQQSIFLRGNGNGDTDYANNGFVSFLQYSPMNDTSLEIRYEHNIFRNNSTIYPFHLQDPYFITFQKNASKKYNFMKRRSSYYRLEFDAFRNKFQYDLATMREYGVGATLSHGSISLQGEKEFSRFYKVLLQVGEYATITGFPFTRPYRDEDMQDMIEKLGFVTEVPQSLLDFYHKKDILYMERQAIIDVYKNSEFCIESEMVLKK